MTPSVQMGWANISSKPDQAVAQQVRLRGAVSREKAATNLFVVRLGAKPAGGEAAQGAKNRRPGAWKPPAGVQRARQQQKSGRSAHHGGGAALEASKISRARFAASERVSPMIIALAEFWKPNQGERFNPRRC